MIEKEIEKVANDFRMPKEPEPLSILNQCAVDICYTAMTGLNGALRQKAINIGIAICEYEDELRQLYPELDIPNSPVEVQQGEQETK